MEQNNEQQKSEFEFEGRTYVVRKPSIKIQRESEPIYMKSFKKALSDGYYLQHQIDELLADMGYDDKTLTKKRNSISERIRELELKLANEQYKGLDEGKSIAFQIQDLRSERDKADAPKRELESKTASMVAENKRFSYYAYACITNVEGGRIWDSFEEFESDESELAVKAATELLTLVYNLSKDRNKDMELKLTENKWLIDNDFMNEKGQLIDKKGRLIDREGRLIDEDGYFINEKGEKVDMFGNRTDEDGQILTKKEPAPKKKSTKVSKVEKEEPLEQPG
jgi:hypothetical protein